MKVTITHNLGDAIAALDGINRDVQRAERSAVGTTTTWAKKQFSTRSREVTATPARVFKSAPPKELKKYRTSSSQSLKAGVAFLGLNPVKGAYLGPLKQEDYGVWAGRYYFAGAFLATMKSGHTGVFMRGPGNKLVEQTAKVEPVAKPVGEQISAEAKTELEQRFITKLHELNPYIY